jgi:hypothetical protein
VTAPSRAMDAISSSFASHLPHRHPAREGWAQDDSRAVVPPSRVRVALPRHGGRCRPGRPASPSRGPSESTREASVIVRSGQGTAVSRLTRRSAGKRASRGVCLAPSRLASWTRSEHLARSMPGGRFAGGCEREAAMRSRARAASVSKPWYLTRGDAACTTGGAGWVSPSCGRSPKLAGPAAEIVAGPARPYGRGCRARTCLPARGSPPLHLAGGHVAVCHFRGGMGPRLDERPATFELLAAH